MSFTYCSVALVKPSCSTEVRVSRIKGIQRLWGETRVTKNCPTAPVIHGALHLRTGGGQPVGILRWRSIQLMPCVRLPFRTTRWSMAGGGLIGNLSGHCPASALSPGRIMSINTPPRSLYLEDNGEPYRCSDVSIRAALLFRLLGRTDLVWSVATGLASCRKGTSCQAPLVHGGQN